MPATRRLSMFVLAAWLVSTVGALAQTVDQSGGIRIDGDGQPYRPWDLTVSTGLQADRDVRGWLPNQYGPDDWDGGWGLQVDVGRYWSSHLKTEVSGALLTTRTVSGYEILDVNGVPAYAFWDARGRRGYISGALTWQFLHNSFAHPFVTAGLRGALLDIDRGRSGYGYTPSGGIAVLAINEQKTEWAARPYVGAGYKSYFYNDRTFLRSELQFGFASKGLSLWTLRTGFGVDF